MAIASVQEWIEAGKPYKEGVLLLKSASSDEALIEMLEEGEDEYNRIRLHAEIKKNFSEEPTKQLPPKTTPGETDQPFKTISKLKKEKWDSIHFTDELKEMSVLAGELTTKINLHRFALEDLPTDQKRLEYARIIMPAAKERAEMYGKLDYFQKHGKLPEAEPEPKQDPVPVLVNTAKIHREYMNVLSNISKAKKKNNQEKLKELIVERDRLKKELGI